MNKGRTFLVTSLDHTTKTFRKGLFERTCQTVTSKFTTGTSRSVSGTSANRCVFQLRSHYPVAGT